jgi:hypothetical protein
LREPNPCEKSRSPDKAYQNKQDHSANRGCNDLSEQVAANKEAKPGEQPRGNERADNANHDVADNAKAIPGHNDARQVAGDAPDDEEDDERFNRHGGSSIGGDKVTDYNNACDCCGHPRELPERQDQTHHNANTDALNDDQTNQ